MPIHRVIHGGGIPQKNEVLNRVYANVLNMPVLVPETPITSLGSAIFAFLACGDVRDDRGGAASALSAVSRGAARPAGQVAVYERAVFACIATSTSAMGVPGLVAASRWASVLPLRRIAAEVRARG